MDDTHTSSKERLRADVEQYVDDCVKDYAGRVDDEEIAAVLRHIANRYYPNDIGSENGDEL